MAISNISVKGLESIRKLVDRLSTTTSQQELEKTLDQGAVLILARIKQRFLQERDPNNAPWPKSKAAMERQAKGTQRRGGTLFNTGRLYNSITATRVGPLQRSIGTQGTPYAAYHQYGTRYLPKRAFIGYNEDDLQEVINLFTFKLRKAING